VPAGPLTDKQVLDAIDKAKEYLLAAQGANGLWPEVNRGVPGPYGNSEMATFMLLYIGVHPTNDSRMVRALDGIMARNLEHAYAVSMRCMALARAIYSAGGDRRELLRKACYRDAKWLELAQGSHGGWDYKSLAGAGGRLDFSNTQMAILALREAALVGAEIDPNVWQRAQQLYMDRQQDDGGWNYGDNRNATGVGYGSMTAAGLASLFICMDNLDLASGCPCRGAVSGPVKKEFENRIDKCLAWLEKNFRTDENPGRGAGHRLYWLYAVERVGIAAGYKYFGTHNWFHEGATNLVRGQSAKGSWGDIPDTCFATLFLYKGRAPILFNKLQETPGGAKWEWNNHRRDMANVVAYFQKINDDTQYAWQIVSLRAPADELHDAPILYITAETEPHFTAEEEQKLRQFTDTGGTILVEASCGNPRIRAWVRTFVRKVWPEWEMKPLGPDHLTFTDRFKLTQRPEILGLDDGVRTFLFFAMDDVSCAWQTKAYTGKEYLFRWAVNMVTYATEHSPIHGKLEQRREPVADQYSAAAKAAKGTLSLARIKYGDGSAWLTGRNYKATDQLVATVQRKAAITLTVDDAGAAAGQVSADIAYVVGAGTSVPNEAERAALKDFAGKGGFIWVEDAGGSIAWDQAFRKAATDMKWDLKDLPADHPIMTGKFATAAGFDLTRGVRFRYSLRTQRLGNAAHADFIGIYQDGKLVGIYTPLDVTFSLTDYDAGGCRGYVKNDDAAVATNILLLAGDRGQ